MIVDATRLAHARLVAELHEVRGTPFLRLHSPRMPARDMLLSLGPEPLCGALACFTPFGRLHTLHWSLAYGRSDLTRPASVHFTSSALRYRREALGEPLPLGGWWVADAEGLFTHVRVQSDGETIAQSTIASARRG